MARLTPQEATAKQASRLKGALQDVTAGINRVTVAPGQLAAQKQDKMLQNLTQAIVSGKWAQRVASVSLEEWKRKAANVGVNRIPAGIDAASGKMIEFYSQLFPYQDSVAQELAKMPDVTLEDSIARMTHQVRRMAQFQFKR